MLTQWFPWNEMPIHQGLYESFPTRGTSEQADFLMEWDGRVWRWAHGGHPCEFQMRTWRGLAENPNKKESE